MSKIKAYNQKLKSLGNTGKITRTMKMVAASKLRKAQRAQSASKLYAEHLTELTGRITKVIDREAHPLLKQRENPSRILIFVLTSDKGLCGGFNHNAHKHVLSWLEENRSKYEDIQFSFAGKRGYQFFKGMESVKEYYEELTGEPSYEDAERIGKAIGEDFMNGVYDEVYIAYNQFISPLSQKTLFDQLLPVEPSVFRKPEETRPVDYILEPSQERLIEYLIPHYFYFRIYFALLENAAGEHGARMSAMDSATKNAQKLIDRTRLLRNRARQSQITTELTEIVAGAEALEK